MIKFSSLVFLVWTCLILYIHGESTDLNLTIYKNENPPSSIPDGIDFYTNIPYSDQLTANPGEQKSSTTLFDFAKVPSENKRTPLIVLIHGGGFNGGDKSVVWKKPQYQANAFLSSGVSVASINYDLMDINYSTEEEGLLSSLEDSALAIQFLRYHAETLNIDPDNISVMGSSAGAGTALWLGYSPDKANPLSENVIERESTGNFRSIGMTGGQTTYDNVVWKDEVFSEWDLFYDSQYLEVFEPQILGSYGNPEVETDLWTTLENDPDVIEYRQKVDMLAFMENPELNDHKTPIWIKNQAGDTIEITGYDIYNDEKASSMLIHHELFASAIKKVAIEQEIECYAYAQSLSEEEGFDHLDDEVTGPTMVDFIMNNFKEELFWDNFNSGNLSLWSVETGDWSISTHKDTNSYLSSNAFYDNRIFTGDLEWNHYTLSMKIRLDELPPSNASCSIYGHYIDFENYIEVRYHNYSQTLELISCKNGIIGVLDTHTFQNTPTYRSTYNIKFELSHDKINFSINERLLLSSIDMTKFINNGKIALEVNQQEVFFDNISVILK